mgnify:FL=1
MSDEANTQSIPIRRLREDTTLYTSPQSQECRVRVWENQVTGSPMVSPGGYTTMAALDRDATRRALEEIVNALS